MKKGSPKDAAEFINSTENVPQRHNLHALPIYNFLKYSDSFERRGGGKNEGGLRLVPMARSDESYYLEALKLMCSDMGEGRRWLPRCQTQHTNKRSPRKTKEVY